MSHCLCLGTAVTLDDEEGRRQSRPWTDELREHAGVTWQRKAQKEDRVGHGQMNSESMQVLHGKGKLRTDIGGIFMKMSSSRSGAK